MSTKERWAEKWACPCGKGEVVFHIAQPDHGWNPSPYIEQEDFTCPICSANLVYTQNRMDVSGAPPESPGWHYMFFIRKEDVAEREEAHVKANRAAKVLNRTIETLQEKAISALCPEKAKRRYQLGAAIFGFDSEEAVKSFVDRRHLPTWVAEASSNPDRLHALASYFGEDETLTEQQEVAQATQSLTRGLGRPPVVGFSQKPDPIAALRAAGVI